MEKDKNKKRNKDKLVIIKIKKKFCSLRDRKMER